MKIKMNTQQLHDKQYVKLIIFIKPSQKQQPQIKQPNTNHHNITTNPNPTSSAKPSSNLIPPPRARTFSTKSHHSAISSSHSVQSPAHNNKLTLKLSILHNQYQYEIKKQLVYNKKVPFSVEYKYCNQYEEYTVKCMCKEKQLKIVQKQSIQQELLPQKRHQSLEQYSVFYQQQLKLFTPFISLHFSQLHPYVLSFPLLNQSVNLKSLIKKQHLKPQKICTFSIQLQQSQESKQNHTNNSTSSENTQQKHQQQYEIFKPIRIYSQQQGDISILKENHKEYELIGKVYGYNRFINYTNKNNTHNNNSNTHNNNNNNNNTNNNGKQKRQLDLYLIPTKKGNIKLPEIIINMKKAIWKNKIITII